MLTTILDLLADAELQARTLGNGNVTARNRPPAGLLVRGVTAFSSRARNGIAARTYRDRKSY